MKKLLLATIALVVFGFGKIYAQQEPQFTHYMFNKLVYNPAAAGTDQDYVTATGLIHNQWTDFHAPEGEKAPVTQTAAVDGAIRPESLRSKNMYIGAGVHFLNDKEGFISTTGFMFSGAFHFEPKFGGDLSVGLNAGMINKAVDPNWKPITPGDPLLTGKTSNAGFDAGLGVYYRSIKWYAGISALHLPATKLDWQTAGTGSAVYNVDRTYFLTAGYNYDIKDDPDLELQPSILIKKDIARTSYGLAALFLYKQRFWGGLNFRSENVTALAVMLGMYITPDLKLGYSYDVATQVPTPFGGTHEVMLSYRFKVKLNPILPVWDKSVRFL